jgi:hypothetical protein
LKKGVLTQLTKPHRDWSGHALYAKCMEHNKELHKKIQTSTKRGEAKASVKKRVKAFVGSDESSGGKAKKRRKKHFQVVGVDGNPILAQEEEQRGKDSLLSQIHSILDGHPDLWSQIEAVFKNYKKGELC